MRHSFSNLLVKLHKEGKEGREKQEKGIGVSVVVAILLVTCGPRSVFVVERDNGVPDAGEQIKSLLVEPAPGFQEGECRQCITLHPAFWALCLYKRHLVGVAQIYRADHGAGTLRFRNENRLCRYLAYREFTAWVYKRLGKNIRKVIPACVVKAIRNAFPKRPDESYEGFHYADIQDPDLDHLDLVNLYAD